MKTKRVIVAAVCLTVLLMIFTPAAIADSSGVCFTATNDLLLDLSQAPYFSGTTAYLPNSVFANFGLSTNYSSGTSTATMSNGSQTLNFEMVNGGSYDGDGNPVGGSAIMRSGIIYVPASVVCSYFGLGYSYIVGSGYGDVVRITSSPAAIDDSSFMIGASINMQAATGRYINEALIVDTTPPPADPGQSDSNPAPNAPPETDTSPPEAEEDEHGDDGGDEAPPADDDGAQPNSSGKSVYISFNGVPNKELLTKLNNLGVETCFFLTEEDILLNPSGVRSIVAAGHIPGVLCGEDSDGDYETVSGLIDEVCRVMPLLISAESEYAAQCKALSDNSSLVYVPESIYANASDVQNIIDGGGHRADLRLDFSEESCDSILKLLDNLEAGNYTLNSLRESTKFPANTIV